MRTLNDLKVGESAIIDRIKGQGPLKRRLMDMGLGRQVEVTVKNIAPLGDPVEVTIRGYQLSLRRSEAEEIYLQ